jgi:hypothetical protein
MLGDLDDARAIDVVKPVTVHERAQQWNESQGRVTPRIGGSGGSDHEVGQLQMRTWWLWAVTMGRTIRPGVTYSVPSLVRVNVSVSHFCSRQRSRLRACRR